MLLKYRTQMVFDDFLWRHVVKDVVWSWHLGVNEFHVHARASGR